MLDDFMVRAGLAGLGVALAAAPLGCFVVWRRLAYIGDATSHAAILGVALALALEIPVFGGVLAVAVAVALLLSALSGRGLGSDALLGVLAHSALAFGLVAVSFLPNARVDLMAYLVGDILAVSRADLGAQHWSLRLSPGAGQRFWRARSAPIWHRPQASNRSVRHFC